MDEWKTDAAVIENHYWDCLIQSAVGASMLGLAFADKTVIDGSNNNATVVEPPKRKIVDAKRLQQLRESV